MGKETEMMGRRKMLSEIKEEVKVMRGGEHAVTTGLSCNDSGLKTRMITSESCENRD